LSLLFFVFGRQSYDVVMELETEGAVARNTLDLKNPYFRYTGQAPPPPPGHHTTAPTEAIWTALESAKATENGLSTLNGSLVDGMGNMLNVDLSNPNPLMGQMTVLPVSQLLTNTPQPRLFSLNP
jgi:histone-arginine methyltransferase CARM1